MKTGGNSTLCLSASLLRQTQHSASKGRQVTLFLMGSKQYFVKNQNQSPLLWRGTNFFEVMENSSLCLPTSLLRQAQHGASKVRQVTNKLCKFQSSIISLSCQLMIGRSDMFFQTNYLYRTACVCVHFLKII